jgi:drug/metabolite transporter (DMT)-like permease
MITVNPRNSGALGADLILLSTAVIWGLAFVAQRLGMEHLGPFAFNAVRFALGSAALLPFIFLTRKRKNGELPNRNLVPGSLVVGTILFFGSSFQQTGLVYTTAGKGGFITGLYVILVPIFGFFMKKTVGIGTWLGAIAATYGLYLLSVSGSFVISGGDLLVLTSAIFWACHVLAISWLSPTADAIKLACGQFAVCAMLSMVVAVIFEETTFVQIRGGMLPLLYSGLCSSAIAYTLQIVGQRKAPAAHAAIIMSLEGVFAAVGGWLLLSETLTPRAIAGCLLMLLGMLLSQLTFRIPLSSSRRVAVKS